MVIFQGLQKVEVTFHQKVDHRKDDDRQLITDGEQKMKCDPELEWNKFTCVKETQTPSTCQKTFNKR